MITLYSRLTLHIMTQMFLTSMPSSTFIKEKWPLTSSLQKNIKLFFQMLCYIHKWDNLKEKSMITRAICMIGVWLLSLSTAYYLLCKGFGENDKTFPVFKVLFIQCSSWKLEFRFWWTQARTNPEKNDALCRLYHLWQKCFLILQKVRFQR